MYLFLTAIIFLSCVIIIYFLNKKHKLMESAQFTFLVGIAATFIGFTLSGFLGEIQQAQEKKDNAISLLQTCSYINKAELRIMGVRVGLMEYETEESIGFSFPIRSKSIDLIYENSDYFSLYSAEFKKTYPMEDLLIDSYMFHNDPQRTDPQYIILLKQVAVEKYMLTLMIDKEIEYIQGIVSSNDLSSFYNEIDSVRAEKLLDISRGVSLSEIIPSERLLK